MLPRGQLLLSSSSTGYATPGGVAEANLQPNCPGFLAGMVRRSPDRCTEKLYSPSDFTPSGAPFLSRENGRSGAEERLACRDLTLPYPVISSPHAPCFSLLRWRNLKLYPAFLSDIGLLNRLRLLISWSHDSVTLHPEPSKLENYTYTSQLQLRGLPELALVTVGLYQYPRHREAFALCERRGMLNSLFLPFSHFLPLLTTYSLVTVLRCVPIKLKIFTMSLSS